MNYSAILAASDKVTLCCYCLPDEQERGNIIKAVEEAVSYAEIASQYYCHNFFLLCIYQAFIGDTLYRAKQRHKEQACFEQCTIQDAVSWNYFLWRDILKITHSGLEERHNFMHFLFYVYYDALFALLHSLVYFNTFLTNKQAGKHRCLLNIQSMSLSPQWWPMTKIYLVEKYH